MPKRTAEEKIEHYQRKIQKIHEKNKKQRRRVRVIHSDSSEENDGEEANHVLTNAEVHETPANEQNAPMGNATAAAVLDAEPEPDNTVAVPEPIEATPEPDLDPDLLEALGEATDASPEYGPKIHENLAKLWLPLLKKGLKKENKDKILKDYLVPENCQLLQAPKLNAEISAAIPDVVRNRDKALSIHQQQLGSGITAINRALDLLLKGDNKKEAIQHISNGCRILSDLHSISTQTRIKLITPGLDKSFLHVIQDTERDDTLFGNKLSEKIKAAKAIEKQGLQIKKANPKSSSSSQSAANRSSTSGNWAAPPSYSASRGRGGSKKSNQSRRSYANPAPRPYSQYPAHPTRPAPTSSKPRAPQGH